MKTIRFGIIGCGLMGREFASAAARWCHLLAADVRPQLTAVCDSNEAATRWFTGHFDSVKTVTHDYRRVLDAPDVDAVYVAVPHHLHAEIYCAAISRGKHLMGEKPFGIDLAASREIMACIERNPSCFVRCSSEFPFYPGVQYIGRMIEAAAFGEILEVNSGFLHSSDLDPRKPINWKRMVEFNGKYGCMGDLGMHVCHMPLRAGWVPLNVRAVLSNIVRERPDGKGSIVPCATWDNATLLCAARDPVGGSEFPLTIKTQRIAPGQKNTWYLEIMGTKASARFSTRRANAVEVLEYTGGEQSWRVIEMGHETAYKVITGGIFEFGFPDAILQMWAAFLHEMEHGTPASTFAGCVTPQETAMSHRLFTAALASHREKSTIAIE